MIFVHVTEEISKSRYISKTEDSEIIRSYKYNNSLENLYKFYSLFDDFMKFDNNLVIENLSQFEEVFQFCEDFFLRGYFTEKKKLKKSKIEKYSDMITADNVMRGNMDRIQPSYDYGVKFEDYMPFSYSGYPDIPLASGSSRISSGEPESYEEKAVKDMIPKKTLDKIKNIRKEYHEKRINK